MGGGNHRRQAENPAAGCFVLVRGKETAQRLTNIINSKRLEMQSPLADADEATKKVLASLSPNEKTNLETLVKSGKKGKWQLKQLYKEFENRIRSLPNGPAHLETLHKCEFVAYFCCAASDSPTDFAAEILKDEKESRYPEESRRLDEAYKAAVARKNLLFEETPWSRSEHARQVNYKSFHQVYNYVIGTCSEEMKKDLFYIIGYEPPSLHAQFQGYPGEMIDFSIFKGKGEAGELNHETIAARETSEESYIDRNILAQAIFDMNGNGTINSPRIYQSGNMKIFPVILDAATNPQFAEWLKKEEEDIIKFKTAIDEMQNLKTK